MAGASRSRWERYRSGWRAYWWASTGRIVVVAERGDDEGRVQSRQPTIPVAVARRHDLTFFLERE